MDSEAAFYPVTFSLSKKPSASQRMKEAKPVILFFLGCFLFGFIIPPLSVMFGMPVWLAAGSNYILYMICMVVIGAAFGLATVFAIRALSRGVLGGDRKKIKALETRLSTGSPDVVADLDALITENMKAGRGPVAEFYSKQLLALCERDHQDCIVPELMLSTPTWVSTPHYHKSINYWLVWLFESRGLMCLTNEHLEYESSRITFRVELKHIVDISIDRHPLWMKPYPLRYIKISFREPEYDTIHCMHLTPYTMQTDTVWDINKTVQEWYINLTRALEKVG